MSKPGDMITGFISEVRESVVLTQLSLDHTGDEFYIVDGLNLGLHKGELVVLRRVAGDCPCHSPKCGFEPWEVVDD